MRDGADLRPAPPADVLLAVASFPLYPNSHGEYECLEQSSTPSLSHD